MKPNQKSYKKYLKMSQLSQNVPTISKSPTYLKMTRYLKMSRLSQNVPTILKCLNYLKISQLSQNVPTILKCPKYLKMSQLTNTKWPNFQQRVNFHAEKKSGLCGNMRDDLIYAKLCGKC